MKTLSIVLFILCYSISLSAQDTGKIAHHIKGKVVDATSNRPVSYTNIGLEGTFFGTASDADGNFELKIPADMVGKNIYFSAVGFKNKQFPVSNLFRKEFNVVKLESQSYGVDEVDVAAQNMVLIRILRMASEDIKYNYGAGPFNLHCTYTNKRMVNNNSEMLSEASVLIYDAKGYSEVSKSDAYASRKYSVLKEADDSDYRFSTGLMNIDDLLELDWARSASSILNPALLNDFKLSLESQPTINGKEYWVITFSQPKPTLEGSGDFYADAFEGKITINKEDYSVLKIEGEVKSSKNNRQGAGLAIGKTNKNYLSDVAYHFSVDYKDLLLEHISLNKTFTQNGKSINEVSVLKVDRAHTNNLTIIDTRDYFAGEQD
uniref:carboxypeptidase-like regulatory domain-containing protein n=1 Tax=uncultured Draconibacterium sp. TaxID=1573823 RepID=UPI003216FE2D